MKKIALIAFGIYSSSQVYAQHQKLIVGTYTNKGTSEGIYVYDYDTKTADTRLLTTTKSISPSFLTVSTNKKSLYSVNETGKESTVSAFSFDAASGKLGFLNSKASEGADPCFVTSDDENVFIANYTGGSISIFGRNADGSLTDPKQIIQHTGRSIDPKRQTSAHVHQIQFTPDKKYMVVNDLGEDKIYIYQYHKKGGDNTLTLKTTVNTVAGYGPRHLTFSPNGKFAYLTHEFTGVITVYNYSKGSLKKIQDIKTTADGFSGAIDAADIHVSADGKFLYETNRGDANTISVFAISPNGLLEKVEIISTLGKGPRNFSIDPTGNFLLVAHQYTNNVVIFKRDLHTGRLTDTGKRIEVGAPVCLVFTK